MKNIGYSGGSFVTGDRIADALMVYAAALANRERSAEIEVPALGLDDKPGVVTVVVGPSSQLLAQDHAFEPELDDDAFVRRMSDLTAELERDSGIETKPMET